MGTDLIEARVVRERAWALEAWHARLSWGQMRAAALRPVDEGGLGYNLSEVQLKALVKRAREDMGDVTMTRDERVERQAQELDARARLARFDLERAHAALMEPQPEPDEYIGLELEYLGAVTAWGKRIETATKLVESADRRLEVVHAREARLFGMDAPTRAEVEVTTRDGMMDDLTAAIAALDETEVEA